MGNDYLHDIRSELQLLNLQTKYSVETLELILCILKKDSEQSISAFTLQQQTSQGDFMSINGTVVGTTSTFQIGFVPATNFIPLKSGPSVTVDDTLVTLTAPDSTGTFTASVAATDTGASYNLTVTGVNDQGATITHVFNVPILPTPPPPPVSITDFSLNQLS